MESYLFDEIKKPLRPFAFDKLQKIKTQKMLTTYYFLQLMMKMHEKVKDNRAAAHTLLKMRPSLHIRGFSLSLLAQIKMEKNWDTALKVNNFKFSSLCFCKPLECKC